MGSEMCIRDRYKMEDARIALLTMGSYSETAMLAVDEMREEGADVGLLRLRLWRPFPFAELRDAVKNVELVVVLDRAVSFGMGGPVCSEVRAALYQMENKNKPHVIGFIGGLGGRDIPIAGFKYMVKRAQERVKEKKEEMEETELFGVRE